MLKFAVYLIIISASIFIPTQIFARKLHKKELKDDKLDTNKIR